ncbi:MAG: D-alanyl-D-alanine carboxypeptidase [Proteobacteria bacterium]|nr:D-alanyl-D-alanine carboxypeptidase [Pseudomonadota bacterium]MBU1649621.1 D-alanyl-D-alanine carboxypeptidase [Pseudomonadota bacterium]MBU1986830.1 D-alanyl-D-alanine carboxypeptidase [Pseudomonadota bacterium]
MPFSVHLNIIANMIKLPIPSLLLASLLLCFFCIGISVTPAMAVPVLQDQAKRSVNSSRTANTIKKNIPQEIQVLGNYQDISPHKKNIGTVRPEAALNVQAASVAEVKTTQCSSRGSRRLEKKISAKSAFIMDAANGETIFAVSPDTPRQPASTIKILTGMIAIKSLDSNDSVPVSSKAAEQPSSKVYLERKKRYKADDLINAVLLSSANDASVALAEKIAGSEKSFARMMTLRAKLWGAQKTVCKTANGLTAEGQSTTARDLATIFRHVMQDEEFSQRMKQIKAHTAEGKLLRNHNKALWQIEGAQGGKTGFTNAAGQTYVGKFKRGSSEIIVAIMGSRTMWTDLKALVEYGFAQQQTSTVAGILEKQGKSRVVASLPMVSQQQ